MVRDTHLDAIEQEMGVLLHRIRKVLRHRATQVHPELSGPAFLILRLVRDRGPLRASAVVETFEVDKGAVSRQVQQLIDLGLVERTTDPDDRRASLLALSAAGEERLAHVDTERRDRLRRRLDDWDDSDLETFVALLSRYNEFFDDLDL